MHSGRKATVVFHYARRRCFRVSAAALRIQVLSSVEVPRKREWRGHPVTAAARWSFSRHAACHMPACGFTVMSSTRRNAAECTPSFTMHFGCHGEFIADQNDACTNGWCTWYSGHERLRQLRDIIVCSRGGAQAVAQHRHRSRHLHTWASVARNIHNLSCRKFASLCSHT